MAQRIAGIAAALICKITSLTFFGNKSDKEAKLICLSSRHVIAPATHEKTKTRLTITFSLFTMMTPNTDCSNFVTNGNKAIKTTKKTAKMFSNFAYFAGKFFIIVLYVFVK